MMFVAASVPRSTEPIHLVETALQGSQDADSAGSTAQGADIGAISCCELTIEHRTNDRVEDRIALVGRDHLDIRQFDTGVGFAALALQAFEKN